MLVYILVFIGAIHSARGDCGPPPVIEHSTNNASSDAVFGEGTTTRYHCAYTHTRYGWPIYTCTDGRWTNGHMSVRCHWKTCGRLYIEHGSFTVRSYTVGNVAHFNCDTGYTIQGSLRSVCRTDGRWTRVPTCQIVRCDPLPSRRYLQRFQPTLTGGRNIYNNYVRNSCPREYRLVGSVRRTCQADGTWSGQDASCLEINCGVPDVGDGIVEGLSAPDQSGMFSLYSSGHVVCNEGSVVTGSNMIYCEPSGWSQSYCQRSCSSSTMQISHGYVTTSSQGVTHGEEVRWACDQGYFRQPPLGQALCNNSRFEPQPLCQQVVLDDLSCLDIYNVRTSRHNNTCYYYTHAQRSYEAAASLCRTYNTKLLIVDSHQTMDYISAAGYQLDEDRTYWLGMQYSDRHDRWVWINNANVNNQHWLPGEGEPTCVFGVCHKFEKCATLQRANSGWGWNDESCDDSYHVICQREIL